MPKINEKDTRSDKISRILTGISMMDLDEFIAITTFSKKIGLHKNTACEKLEEYEPVKNINWRLVRGKNKEIKGIVKTDEDIEIRRELRELKKSINELIKLKR